MRSTTVLLHVLQKEQPDIVHLQCINEHFVNIYRLIGYLRDKQVPTLLTLHADFMFTANCGSALACEGYRSGCRTCHEVKRATKSIVFNRTAESFELLQEAFEGFGENLSVVSVSPWLMERAKESPMLAGFRHATITNGVDTRVFRPVDAKGLRERYSLGSQSIVLHVTAQFDDAPGHLKGGAHLFKLARRMANEPVIFVVIGPHRTSDAVPENVLMLGSLSDANELACWYTAASCTVLTSQQETFSLVCAESLCCGTPVVGFRAGGPESIAMHEASAFVSYGDVDALENCVQMFLAGERKNRLAIAEQAHLWYANEVMVRRYEEEYRRMQCL